MKRLLVLIVMLLSTIVFSSYYLGANKGYEIGHKRGVADRTINDLKNNKIECKYVK